MSNNDHFQITDKTDDDKGYFESTTDSGFISGSNLRSEEDITISGEIPEEDSTSKSDLRPGDDKEEKQSMHLDSGLCLSESFSNLSLANSGLNNLSCSKFAETPVDVAISYKPPKQTIDGRYYYEQDEDGDTPLHLAIVMNKKKLALHLIQVAPLPRLLDTPNDNAQTPLHLSVMTQQLDVTRWLVVAGARRSPRDLTGDSPLHIAARIGSVELCRALVEPVQQQERDALNLSYQHVNQQCNLDQWNYQGQTCVHVAAICGHVNVLRHLSWYGANMNAREGCMGYTALHFAVQRRDEQLLHYLLKECPQLDVEAVTYGGRSALQLGYSVPKNMSEALLNRGVPSPFSSSDEEDDDDTDDDSEASYENSKMFVPNLVNASA